MSHSNLRIAIRSVVAALAMLVLSATAVFAEDGNILEPQHGIPLVVINIDESEEAIAAAEANDDKHDYGTIAEMNESEKHSVRCVGTVEIKVPDDYDLPGSDTSWVEKSLKLDYIRGRGNSTWSDVSKRPYKFKLSNKADLFGMGKSKEWALMANYYDDSIIHNRITYWLGKQIGMPYNMEGVPVEVVMQGAGDPVYLGCYDLSELVEVDASRVAIEKDGGYLFSIFNEYQKDDPESNTFKTKQVVPFHFDDPEFMDEDSLTEEQKAQRQYLIDYVQSVEDLIFDCDVIDQERHDEIAAKLDLKSVADYWLIQEFTDNGDAYGTGSTYFFKPKDGKMHFGPLWDFDIAWGILSEGEEAGLDTEGFNNTTMIWVDELRAKDPEFVKILEQEWAKLDPALTELTKSGGVMDQYRDEIKAAYEADPVIAEKEDHDLGVNVENLRRWTNARHEWMKNNEDKLGAIYATVTYVADGKTVFVNNKVRIGKSADDDPKAPDKDGFYFTGWFTEDGSPMEDVQIVEDTTFYAKYIEEDQAIVPTALYLQDYELWAEAGSMVDVSTEYTIIPSDALSQEVTWTSSDETIATVDPIGAFELLKAGDVVMTATTINGIKAELLIHVTEEDGLERKDPEGIVFDEPEMKLETGKHAQAKWTIKPEGEAINKNYYLFSSSDDAVVEIDRLGVVTAIGPGTAEVTMTVCYGDEQEISATFKVTVTDPDSSSKDDSSAADKGAVNSKVMSGGNTYVITKAASAKAVGTVALAKAANKKSVKIPSTVTIKGKKYNVTKINAKAFKGKKIRTITIGKNVKTLSKNAFRGSKATRLIIKSKKLTKKSVRGSLYKSKIKRAQVKVGKKKINKKYRKRYRKSFTRKNAGKKIKIS